MLFAAELLSTARICERSISSAPSPPTTTSVSPRVMRSPVRMTVGSSSFVPFSSVPFTLPQSRTIHWPASNVISAWCRDRNRSLIGIVHSLARPSVIGCSDVSAIGAGGRLG